MRMEKMFATSFKKEKEGNEEVAKEKIHSDKLSIKELLEIKGKSHFLNRVSDAIPQWGIHSDNVDNSILGRDKLFKEITEKMDLKASEFIDFINKKKTEVINGVSVEKILDDLTIDNKILSSENFKELLEYDYKDDKYKKEFLEEFNQEMEELTSDVGSNLHQDWQEGVRKSGLTERIKSTKDEEWIKKNGTDKVDILNTNFSDLPKDWQKENFESAKVAVDFLYDDMAKYGIDNKLIEAIISENQDRENLSPAYSAISEKLIEDAARKIHDAWMERKIAEGYDENNEKWAWEKKLMVDYSKLSEEEKEKDRKIFKITLKKYSELASKKN